MHRRYVSREKRLFLADRTSQDEGMVGQSRGRLSCTSAAAEPAVILGFPSDLAGRATRYGLVWSVVCLSVRLWCQVRAAGLSGGL